MLQVDVVQLACAINLLATIMHVLDLIIVPESVLLVVVVFVAMTAPS